MKYVVLVFFLVVSLYAQKLIEPQYIYKVSSGMVSDLLSNKHQLYIATDDGNVIIFDTESKKEIHTIHLQKIQDFMGDEVGSKIFSLDMLENRLMILSQDGGGYSRVHIYNDGNLKQVISKDDMLNIIKAKFIDKDTLLLALISNDIISYNIKTKKKNWVTQASMSKFSSFALNNDRSIVAIADESGDVHLLSVKDGHVVKKLSGENVDNIFSIAFRGDIVLTGGQDRRAAVYNIQTGNAYHKKSNFFVYGVGLSPSGKIGAYSSDLNNNVTLFHTQNEENIATYKSNQTIVNGIYFINENEFFVNSSSKTVGYYKVK